jgi:hypothetical protein
MGWSDYPLTSITLPANHPAGGSYTYIGPDDPIAQAAFLDSAIVFHFGSQNSAFLLGVSNEVGVFPDDGHLQLIGRSDASPSTFNVIDVDWQPGSNFASTTFGDNHQFSRTAVQSYGDLYLSVLDESTNGGHIRAGSMDLEYGVRDSVQLTTSGAAVSAETVIATIPAMSYPANRAYQVVVDGGFTPSLATSFADVRLKKTSTAGQALGEYFRYPAAAAGVVSAMHGARAFKVGAAAVTGASLVVTMQTTSGTVTQSGSATSPFTVTVRDCGPADQFPNAPTLV